LRVAATRRQRLSSVTRRRRRVDCKTRRHGARRRGGAFTLLLPRYRAKEGAFTLLPPHFRPFPRRRR
jgi:hypothetical protein